MQQSDLLRGIQIGEEFAAISAATLINACQAEAILRLQVFVRTTELAVDEVDDTGPGSAGILVWRDDLIADRGQRARLIYAEEAPWAGIAATSDSRASRGGGHGGGLEEGAAVELGKRLHAECSDRERYREGDRGSVIGITLGRDGVTFPGQKPQKHSPRRALMLAKGRPCRLR